MVIIEEHFAIIDSFGVKQIQEFSAIEYEKIKYNIK